MAQITFTISDDKVLRVRDALLWLQPNIETIPDPNWVDPLDGSENPGIPKYNDTQWLKEIIRRDIVRKVLLSEARKAKQLADESIEEADSVIT